MQATAGASATLAIHSIRLIKYGYDAQILTIILYPYYLILIRKWK